MQFLLRNMKKKTMVHEGTKLGASLRQLNNNYISTILSIYCVLAIVLLLYMFAHFQQPKMVITSVSFDR